MITEDYVSYDVAKLLKEKGFDETCRSYYKGRHSFMTDNNTSFFNDDPENEKLGIMKRPTHQMAMKWLREKYKMDIFLSTDYPINRLKYTYTIVIPSIDGDKQTDMLGGSYDTYEEAVEAALKYSLENLI